MSVSIRELKANLSRVLSRAQAGEVIEITSHNKPIGRIVGVPRLADEGLRGLIVGGAVCWSGGKPSLAAPLGLTAPGTSVSEIILQDRR